MSIRPTRRSHDTLLREEKQMSWLVRSLLVLLVATCLPRVQGATSSSNCGSVVGGCGPFGTCFTDTTDCVDDDCKTTCKCQRGYAGDDCSIMAETCKDEVAPNGAQTCFNGGRCEQKLTYKNTNGKAETSWVCDCSKAVGDAKRYAGFQCEFPATTSCEIGVSQSTYAFCTNGGTCKYMVKPGQPHPLCNCEPEFEGRHCQFAKGTAPANEQVYSPLASPDDNSGGLNAFGIVLAVLVSLVFIGIVFYAAFIMKVTANLQNNNKVDPYSIPTDLHLREFPPGESADEDDIVVDVPLDDTENKVV